MPRGPRLHVPGGVYHAVLRGNHRQPIFFGDDDYRIWEGFLAEALERFGARVHAYCWMTNHVHMAIQVADAPLGRLIHLVASRYARSVQRRVPTTGHLFERRYRAKPVAGDRYLVALVRYIHNNPVRAGIVANPADYPWSSHCAYLGRVPNAWLTVGPMLAIFHAPGSDGRVGYCKFMSEDPSKEELEVIRPPLRDRKRDSARPTCPATRETGFGTPCRESTRTLEEIVVEVAVEFGIDIPDVVARCRKSRLVNARVEIARRAMREGVATVSQVAERVDRSPSTLSELLGKASK